MKPFTLTPLALALVALLGVDTAAVAQDDAAKDTVMTTTGRRLRAVAIVGLTDSTLTYKQGSDEKEIRAAQVAEITWDDPPEAYALGRASANRGDFDSAADQYAEAASSTSRDVFKVECEYLAAESLARHAQSDAGAANEAAEKLASWLDANPDGYRRPDALLWRGRALVAASMFDEAESTFEQLADDGLSRGWQPIWNARAKLELALAKLAAGNYAGSRSAYRAAVTAISGAMGDKPTEELQELEAKANVGIGESMVREGNFAEALRYFRDLSNRSQSPLIRAAALAGEGEALFMQAESSDDAKGLRAAQVALARANFLDPTGADTTAKALYYSGKVLLALGPERESQTYKQRAASYFESVVRHYGGTVWATRAGEELRR